MVVPRVRSGPQRPYAIQGRINLMQIHISRIASMMPRKTPSLLIAAIGLPLIAPSAALADNNLNCNAYAQAAVAHQQQNLKLRCGFSGRRWSLNHARHFTWCRLANVRMANLTFEDRARANALNACKAKVTTKGGSSPIAAACRKAATAAQAWRGAVQQACKGLPEGREWPASWQSDFQNCLNRGVPHMDRQNAERKRIAGACARKKRTRTFTTKDRLRHNTGRYGWLPIDVCNNKDRGPGTSGLYNTCGKQWANELCKRFGYARVTKIGPTRPNDQRASKFGVKADRPSTWWAGSRRICHGRCFYFTSITCTK